MENILEIIVEECNLRGLDVSVDTKNGDRAYRVKGFSKSGNALLYVDDDKVICETRYDQKDHILNFDDLVLIAKQWYEMYRDREPFENIEPEWEPIFKKYYDFESCSDDKSKKTFDDIEELPF